MTKETITFEEEKMEFAYDESLLGKDMSVFTGAQAVVASLTYKGNVFTLESNGERGEYWLEVVQYEPDGENKNEEASYSDPIHEMPENKEEAKEIIMDWYQTEINELIAS